MRETRAFEHLICSAVCRPPPTTDGLCGRHRRHLNKGGRGFRTLAAYQDGAPARAHSFATLPRQRLGACDWESTEDRTLRLDYVADHFQSAVDFLRAVVDV